MKTPPQIPLRRLTLRDAAELFAVVDANREHLRTWLPWVDGCTSVADTRQFLLDVSHQYSRNLGGQYAITQAKRIVGVAGFHPINWQSQRVALGYWLDRNHCGRGIVTTAVRQLIDQAFDIHGLECVELRIATENHASRAIAQRLQFREVSHTPNAEKLYDRWVDHVVYSAERESWLDIRSKSMNT